MNLIITTVMICQNITSVKVSITTQKVTDVIIYFAMEKTFIEWLEDELQERSWNGSELSRRSGMSQASVSMVLSGRRQAGNEFCDGVAKAFKMPPETVYRIAGLLPVKPNADEVVLEITHLSEKLDEANREDVRDYARLRLKKQEREHSDNKSPRNTPHGGRKRMPYFTR